MICLKKRSIGKGHPCFITFEAGATHDGVESALALVDAAADAGADAVKFQVFDPDRLVADKKQQFSYDILKNRRTGQVETVAEPLYDILCRRVLAPDQWQAVKARADKRGLAFFATVCSDEDIQLVSRLGCDSMKISSADINHWPLIRAAAKTGVCIQLDTGCATLGEIGQAVDICMQAGNRDIIIHNCPSGYPARLESINLHLITTLKQMFPEHAVAFSDHTPGWDMDIAAVALGADLLEKTITLDQTIAGPEHMFSLEPDQMQAFISCIRQVETAMGNPRRCLTPEEKNHGLAVRRSTFLKSSVKKGNRITHDQVVFQRPGFGISPDRFEKLSGSRAARHLESGHMLAYQDLVML